MKPNSSPGPRGPENREVESPAMGTEKTKLGKIVGAQAKGSFFGAGAAVGAWRRMVAARGYFPTQRERGSVHTEDAVGRHRP